MSYPPISVLSCSVVKRPFTLHAGEKPTPEKIEEMEKEYRKNIKKSPMWDMILKEYGEARAEELLLECKVKID